MTDIDATTLAVRAHRDTYQQLVDAMRADYAAGVSANEIARRVSTLMSRPKALKVLTSNRTYHAAVDAMDKAGLKANNSITGDVDLYIENHQVKLCLGTAIEDEISKGSPRRLNAIGAIFTALRQGGLAVHDDGSTVNLMDVLDRGGTLDIELTNVPEAE